MKLLHSVHGIGVRPARYSSTNGLHYLILEIPLEVDHVVRNPENLRHGARIVHIVERAAAPGRLVALDLRQPPLIPKLHGQADDVFAASTQHACDDGAIDAT